MRSLKFLSVAALLAALVAGPALAQDAVSPVVDASMAVATDAATPVKAKAKHAVKKHKAKVKKHHKKAAAAISVGQ